MRKMGLRYSGLIIIGLSLVLVSCGQDENPVAPRPGAGFLFGVAGVDLDGIDNMLRVTTYKGYIVDRYNFADTSSENWSFGAALFLYFNGVAYAVDDLRLGSTRLRPPSNSLFPIYYGPEEDKYNVEYIPPSGSYSWHVKVNQQQYDLSYDMPAHPSNLSISPMDTIDVSRDVTVTWTASGHTDTLIAEFIYDPALTELYDSSVSVSHKYVQYPVVSKDDDGSVTFTSSSLSAFPSSGTADLQLSWIKHTVSDIIPGKKTLLLSIYQVSMPVVIKM